MRQHNNNHLNTKISGHRIWNVNILLTNPVRFILSRLNTPFIFPQSVMARLLISGLFGFFVFLFLRIFLPFKLSGIPVDKTVFISVYGLNTTAVIAIWLFVFPLVWKGMFNPETYTVGKYLFLCFGNTMAVCILSWIYTRTAGANILPHYRFIPFTLFTFSVGIFPVAFLTLIIDAMIQKSKARNAIINQTRHQEIQETDNSGEEVNVRNSSGSVQLRFHHRDFICARSVENYVQIHYLQNGSLKTGMVRIPIAKFVEQVSNVKTIVRCHRSVVVNLAYIKQVSGKSRSLELYLELLDKPVPVSREFPRNLLYDPVVGMLAKKTAWHPPQQT